jgi:hypothetical protein
MPPRLLGLALVFGCASGQHPAPEPRDSTAAESLAVELDEACRPEATVIVHVENQSSTDMEITFGPYTAARATEGFSQATYRVPRTYLRQDILLRVRGGLQVNPPSRIPTEHVVCNDATLIIGPRPSNSFFYGDLVDLPPPRRQKHDTTGTSEIHR